MGREARALRLEPKTDQKAEPLPVSELLALKIENATLKLNQLQATAEKFTAEQQAALAQARADVNAPAEWTYDLNARTFRAP